MDRIWAQPRTVAVLIDASRWRDWESSKQSMFVGWTGCERVVVKKEKKKALTSVEREDVVRFSAWTGFWSGLREEQRGPVESGLGGAYPGT